jgi:hypothetical protein
MNIIGPSLLYATNGVHFSQNKHDLNWSLVALNPHSDFHP